MTYHNADNTTATYNYVIEVIGSGGSLIGWLSEGPALACSGAIDYTSTMWIDESTPFHIATDLNDSNIPACFSSVADALASNKTIAAPPEIDNLGYSFRVALKY